MLRRENYLDNHLKSVHPGLGSLKVKHHVVRHLRRTAVPTIRRKQEVRALPELPVSSLDILSSIIPVRQSAIIALGPSNSQPKAPLSQGHRRGRLETLGKRDVNPSEDMDELDCPDTFPDLPEPKRRKVEPFPDLPEPNRKEVESEVLVLPTKAFQLQAAAQLAVPPPVRIDPETGLQEAPESFGFALMYKVARELLPGL